MLGIADVQAALITRLQALTSTGVPSDVAEFDYQGTGYSYPCVRLRVGPITPLQRSGPCRCYTVPFEVITYAEDHSSSVVSAAAKAIENGLDNYRLTVGSNKSTPIKTMQVLSPIPLPNERGWAEHALYQCEVPA